MNKRIISLIVACAGALAGVGVAVPGADLAGINADRAEDLLNHKEPPKMKLIETDAQSGAAIYLLGPDMRPADNIYGEQPYSDPTGKRIAIRYYPVPEKPAGLSLVDLTDGARFHVMTGQYTFPAFHAWGSNLYWNETVADKLVLRRCNFFSSKVEEVAELPTELGEWFSYGTVSPDQRYYAVAVRPKPGAATKLHLLDLQTGKWSVLFDQPDRLIKHEQFSLDGRNRILVQANEFPAAKRIFLGEIALDGRSVFLPADAPFTPRPTGHETWIGNTARVLFSTSMGSASNGTLWTAQAGDQAAKALCPGQRSFVHVSVSRDGKYWVADTQGEKDVPLYVGKLAGGGFARLLLSRTVMADKKQWSHTHPYFTADNQWVIFNSTRGGHPQVYGAKLAAGWLERLR